MPESSQSVSISGSTSPVDSAFVYVTYQGSLLYPSAINGGAFDRIPSFMYFGDVQYRIDNQGNALAVTPNRDGSLPA